MNTLILICGASGQGKSTLSDALVLFWKTNGYSCQAHEADHYMLEDGQYEFNPQKLGLCHKFCFDACEEDMKNGVEVIIQSNTNLLKKHRQPYINLARKYNYKIQEIFIRGDNFGNLHGVSTEKVQQMQKSLEF